MSDVKKSKLYSEERDRIRFISFDVTFQGKNKDHHITYDDGKWDSSASFFKSRGVCSHTMAMERLLKGMVKPITLAVAETE